MRTGFALYDLPAGHRISAEEFDEFGDAYETFSSTRRFVDDLRNAVSEAQKPVLLLEGKPTSNTFKPLPDCLVGTRP